MKPKFDGVEGVHVHETTEMYQDAQQLIYIGPYANANPAKYMMVSNLTNSLNQGNQLLSLVAVGVIWKLF